MNVMRNYLRRSDKHLTLNHTEQEFKVWGIRIFVMILEAPNLSFGIMDNEIINLIIYMKLNIIYDIQGILWHGDMISHDTKYITTRKSFGCIAA